MSNWLAETIHQAEKIDDWLSPKRAQSLSLLKSTAWPTRQTEAWKYTPINVIERAVFKSANDPQIQAEQNSCSKIPNLQAIDLIFVDGIFDRSASTQLLPEGLTISSLSEGADLSWALSSFNQTKPKHHFFGLINDTLATQGCIIDVAEDQCIDQPIRIAQSFSLDSQSHTRILVRLGKRAKVTVIEQLQGDQLSFNTSFAEYQIADHAYLEHYRLAMQCEQAISVGGCHFHLGTSSQLNSNLIGFGSQLSRVDMDIIHTGEHSNAKANVIYLLDGKEVFDLHSAIEHTVANGVSEQNIRCIVADRANAIFNGRIHIHRNAQKILAAMNNRNLLLSDNAQINTKPELEIYADDVRCAHSATIAEIDDEAMFYLQSRGVNRGDAQVLLSFGFINELVDQMNNAAIAQWLRPILRQRFANMEIR
ncbi:MAG: feS assembly protein SufD [Osedax symbiont Rs1]|nr:MAG: feS assembly protein SufD [Osedax symbiont Rs1]